MQKIFWLKKKGAKGRIIIDNKNIFKHRDIGNIFKLKKKVIKDLVIK